MDDRQNLHAGHRQRMKARFLDVGASGLERHQLVELLLFFGIPRKDTNELAHRLLNTFGSLSGLISASYEELRTVPGMTPNAATLICLMEGVLEECQRERFSPDNILNSTEKLAEYMIAHYVGIHHEQVFMVCLDNNGRILADGILSEGSVASSEINVRQALQLALRCNATVAVLAHNHPGGQPIPSEDDISATRTMAQALAVAGVRLADHIIVAGNSYLSMRGTPYCESALRAKIY